jgi:uncharacterized protein (TIGR02145 family)
MNKIRKIKILFIIFIVALIFFGGCSIVKYDDYSNLPVTDIDGNVYNTIVIGKQKWMAENLNVSHYNNGDTIPQVQDKDLWQSLRTGAWCYYENKSGNGTIYGKLYNWYAVNDPRRLAPDGWSIPSDMEWTKLTDSLGGETEAGEKMKSLNGWYKFGYGTNESGFTALPGGMRYSKEGIFADIGLDAFFWSSSEEFFYNAWNRTLSHYFSSILRAACVKEDGLSVRCIKNSSVYLDIHN